MNLQDIFGFTIGAAAFLIFLAMALCNSSWAGPHQRGDDLGPMAAIRKRRKARLAKLRFAFRAR